MINGICFVSKISIEWIISILNAKTKELPSRVLQNSEKIRDFNLDEKLHTIYEDY